MASRAPKEPNAPTPQSHAPCAHLGAACPRHRVAVGDLLLEEPGGASRTATLKRHVPYARREGVEHNVVNANPFDFAFIEIEHLKSHAAFVSRHATRTGS